jgi:hypothetical protein
MYDSILLGCILELHAAFDTAVAQSFADAAADRAGLRKDFGNYSASRRAGVNGMKD